MKKLLPAFAMLTVSAVSLSSATYAWFSMNTTVTAQGMQVKAKAEGGIVISNSQKSTWSATADSNLTTVTELLPTSTKNLTNWYHGTSEDPSSANSTTSTTANNAVALTNLKVSNNIGYADANNNNTLDTGEATYYLVTDYYIKSTTSEALSSPLYIKNVSVSTTTSGTTDLDGSLRVGIKYGDTFKQIYGSTSTSTSEYYVGAQTTEKTTINAYNTQNVQVSNVASIPNTNDGALLVQIFVWFEGEDANCFSNNIAGKTPDTLAVTVQFSTTNT